MQRKTITDLYGDAAEVFTDAGMPGEVFVRPVISAGSRVLAFSPDEALAFAAALIKTARKELRDA